ncbi:EXLDI protein [Nocardia sp. XZ_19_369]|uniref:EXLDI protein n=1 Tax=Nocardia sp. XZ_19_369 TaxID=2769487 RepID=UPI00188E3E6E|nr:EXLDI protein [Nocardia sp. XZ_19_369]
MSSESVQAVVVEGGVDFEKADPEGFGEVVLKVGPGSGRVQRFAGRRVGESTQVTKAGVELVRVYLSRKGKYVVHKQSAEWTDFSVVADWVKELKKMQKKNWRGGVDLDNQSWGDRTLEVVDSFEELRERVPAKIFRTLTDTSAHPPIEDLDI